MQSEQTMQPTLCMLLGFRDFAHAEPFLDERTEPERRVVLRVRKGGYVVYEDDSDYLRMRRRDPKVVMMNARGLRMCVFVLAERMSDISVLYVTNVGHVLCAPGTTPMSASDAVWFDMYPMTYRYAYDRTASRQLPRENWDRIASTE